MNRKREEWNNAGQRPLAGGPEARYPLSKNVNPAVELRSSDIGPSGTEMEW